MARGNLAFVTRECILSSYAFERKVEERNNSCFHTLTVCASGEFSVKPITVFSGGISQVSTEKSIF